jgi:hypothetical protein
VISIRESQAAVERKLADQMFLKAQREWISHLLAQASVTDTFGRPIPKEIIMRTLDETGQESSGDAEATDTPVLAAPTPEKPAPEPDKERSVGGMDGDD